MRRIRSAVGAILLITVSPLAHAKDAKGKDDDDDDDDTKEIVIKEHAPAEAASSVHFTKDELEERPHDTPSDLLRQTPGLVVAQHAGGGKADQLFLRGFDADHGTDVAISVDGVPANMTSHAHGQGYADTHWLIPDVVRSIDVHKGPYSARFGDFYTAGAVEFTTIDALPEPGLQVSATGGLWADSPRRFTDPQWRLVAIASPRLGTGSAIFAGEYSLSDGPFENAQDFRRTNLFGKWSAPLGGGKLTLITTAFAARWNASGQIPSRATGMLVGGRFGAIDPSEGGDSSRESAVLKWTSAFADAGQLELTAYAVDYRMRLYSDFTLFARDPLRGDEIEQTDARTITGVKATYSRRHTIDSLHGTLRVGAESRFDDVDAELWHDELRTRLDDCFGEGANPCTSVLSRIRDLSGWVEEDLHLGDSLRAIAGLRYDAFVWDVDDRNPRTVATTQTTGGSAQHQITNPKLSVIWSPSRSLDVFANAGGGFHSNDARAAVATHGQGALARALGAEVGARTHLIDGLEAAVALWYLHLSSEQVWNGDEGGTLPAGATDRYGVDLDFTYDVTRWLRVDGNIALAHSQFSSNAGNGNALALAPKIMGGGGVAFHKGPAMISLRARGLGARPANDANTLTAEGYLIFDLVASYRLGRRWGIALTIDNLLDSAWREAQFAETTRLSSEPAPVEDVSFTPGTPFVTLVTATYTY
jgi:outer membrane receptor protein involved in Fe transport